MINHKDATPTSIIERHANGQPPRTLRSWGSIIPYQQLMHPIKLSARRIPIRWKQIMPNGVITWLVWLASLFASLAVSMHWNVPCAYLSSHSPADNSTGNAIQTTQLMLRISSAHNFRYSRNAIIASRKGTLLPTGVDDAETANWIIRWRAGLQ